jgi:hypothetical protein
MMLTWTKQSSTLLKQCVPQTVATFTPLFPALNPRLNLQRLLPFFGREVSENASEHFQEEEFYGQRLTPKLGAFGLG